MRDRKRHWKQELFAGLGMEGQAALARSSVMVAGCGATGGSIARRLVLERRPKCLIAVACERDLTSGIQDVAPLPVLGIFNTRPFGPCLDTDVAVPEVEAALRALLGLPPLEQEPFGHA